LSAETNPPASALKFSNSDRFIQELRRRVDAYFENTGHKRRDCPQMYFKTASILAWFIGAYLLLLFCPMSWWLVGLFAAILGVAIAAIGFNIQHDGGHRAYSERRWVNKVMALTLDLMGGSSYLWDWKHNSIHHTYPNIDGHDDDINVGFLGRLSPQQKRYWFHRLQGIYLWGLYGFLAIKWHFFDDFYNIAVGRIGGHKIPRPGHVHRRQGAVLLHRVRRADAAASVVGRADCVRDRGIRERRRAERRVPACTLRGRRGVPRAGGAGGRNAAHVNRLGGAPGTDASRLRAR
jgi:hypothetical protein